MPSTNHPSPPHRRVTLPSLPAWLIRPLFLPPTTENRRPHLLAWLLLSILVLTLVILAVVLLVDPVGSVQRNVYPWVIIGLDIFVALAYILNCAGYYSLAAGLTVIGAVLAPWASTILDPAVLQGDFVPLGYTIISVLLASILLSPMFTAVLAICQLFALALVPFINPTAVTINWPSFIVLIIVTSVLSILSSMVSQSELRQIDTQTTLLTQREEMLRELSVRDHLTKLFNRRYLEEYLEREIRRSVQFHYNIGIILFDIDHFKQINDKHGHSAGDLVLQELACFATSLIRGGDIACRYGGEEFVLVLPQASQQATWERAQLLREKVKHLQLDYDSTRLNPITLSLGVAIYPQNGSTAAEILKSADSALYHAKSKGRDCVAVADRTV